MLASAAGFVLESIPEHAMGRQFFYFFFYFPRSLAEGSG